MIYKPIYSCWIFGSSGVVIFKTKNVFPLKLNSKTKDKTKNIFILIKHPDKEITYRAFGCI